MASHKIYSTERELRLRMCRICLNCYKGTRYSKMCDKCKTKLKIRRLKNVKTKRRS